MAILIKINKGEIKAKIMPIWGDTPPRCKECNQNIRFAKTTKGSMMPISQDDNYNWVHHKVVCPVEVEKRNK